MSSYSMTSVINAPAEEVWKVIREFNETQKFSPAVADSVLETDEAGPGALRTITMRDGAKALDRLDELDDKNMIIKYSILESEPLFPFRAYQATMSLNATDHGRCKLEWSCFFLPRGDSEGAAISLINAVYSGGIAGLKRLLEK